LRDILALIDPFSQEAKEILSQTTSISSLPENIQEKALNRYHWKKDEKIFQLNSLIYKNYDLI